MQHSALQILRGAIRLDRMVQQKIPFGGIDILRFLAAVLVMVYHNGFWVWDYPDRISAPATGGLPEQPGIGAWVGSGYRRRDLLRHQRFRHCLQPENSTPLRFFEARVKRLAPAVWICAPTTAALLLLIGLSWPTDAVIRLVRTGLFAPYGPWVDSVYWTLGIEIAFYAIVWILLRLGRFHLMERVAIVIGMVSTLFWCLYYPLGWSAFAETRWLAWASACCSSAGCCRSPAPSTSTASKSEP
ncbi:peptidoglycan/LPS O-acetylase OafA/YrhL [Mesorhizobium sp. URHB0026]